MAELSRGSIELMITVSDPELRITVGWTASDEIPLPRLTAFFHRAIGRCIR
jgi:hypothetical protein